MRTERGTTPAFAAFSHMFLFFSNGLGLAGSVVVSIVLTLALLYACSGP
jgi:hypothetical protein